VNLCIFKIGFLYFSSKYPILNGHESPVYRQADVSFNVKRQYNDMAMLSLLFDEFF
jgi:hypothetical protein